MPFATGERIVYLEMAEFPKRQLSHSTLFSFCQYDRRQLLKIVSMGDVWERMDRGERYFLCIFAEDSHVNLQAERVISDTLLDLGVGEMRSAELEEADHEDG